MPVPIHDALRMGARYFFASALWWGLFAYGLPKGISDPAALQIGRQVGTLVWLSASTWLVFHLRARLLAVLGDDAHRRVTEQARLRMAAAVFDSTHEGVLVTGSDGLIVHVNRAFMRITGYDHDEVVGQRPSKFKSGRHGPHFYRNIYATLDQCSEWSGEIWNRRKNGEIYPQWQTIRAVRDEQHRISHYVAVFSDISAIKHTAQELAHLAHHDPLTGLPNRLLFGDRVQQVVSNAQSNRRACALLLLDLDHFQSVNDGLGHTLGDQLLKRVGERLQDVVGPTVTLARLGGDEFAVLLDDCVHLGQAAATAQRLLERMREPFMLDAQRLFISASVGISLYPSDALSAEQLLRNADAALFKAKQNGRACYALYTEELTAHAQARVETVSELRRALEQHELRVFYQPVHDLAGGQRVGVEALVRWQHPERGLLAPSAFVPVAERTGLIAELDLWVLRHACLQMMRWHASGEVLDFVAVNLSGRLFTQRDLYLQVGQVLRDTGLDPRLLELEVTESAVMEDPEIALEQLHRLRDLGVRLAIDDFGTGYSSLLRLKRLPVQKLKIDQGFVAGLPGDEDDAAIVRVIIALAHSMGMQVHAEGIEHAEQAAFLRQHDCELGQGYWYGKPAPE